jgi:hypothetical protein
VEPNSGTTADLNGEGMVHRFNWKEGKRPPLKRCENHPNNHNNIRGIYGGQNCWREEDVTKMGTNRA